MDLPHDVLDFYGVPRGFAGASRGRTVLIWSSLAIVLGMLYLWPVVYFSVGPQLTATVFTGAVIGLIGVLYAFRSNRSGRCRYTLWAGGIGIEPGQNGKGQETRAFLAFAGDEVLLLRRVHPISCRLTIKRPGAPDAALDTSVRCLAASEQIVVEALATFFGGRFSRSGTITGP